MLSQMAAMKPRNQRANMLYIICASVSLITLVCVILLSAAELYILERHRGQSAADAAALAAAQTLSNIVIDDPQWGFVSLSDHPAFGAATIAPDGEALPVTGFNTIVADVRLEKLTGLKLENSTLGELAEEDYQKYKALASKLQAELNRSVEADQAETFKDMNGHKISPYKSAYDCMLANLPEISLGHAKIKSFVVSLGGLDDEPEITAKQPDDNPLGYRMFVDQPVKADSFFFAGLPNQTRLVDTGRFRGADGKRFSCCVLVKTEIEFTAPLQHWLFSGDGSLSTLSFASTALPYCEENHCTPGTLIVSLPQGRISQVQTICDLISKPEFNRAKCCHLVACGDYPANGQSRLVEDAALSQSVARATGRALFDWLRSCNGHAHLTSILTALNSPFEPEGPEDSPDLAVAYTVDSTGNVVVGLIHHAAFNKRTIADRQSRDQALNVLAASKGSLCIDVRDEVSDLNSFGSHGGQPLPAEIPQTFSQLALQSMPATEQPAADARPPVRQSYRQGGLAVAIELYCVPG
jgi:hypothetical protein